METRSKTSRKNRGPGPLLRQIRYITVHHLAEFGCTPTHKGRVDGPGIELLACLVHTQHSWLHNTVFVGLDGRMHLVEVGVSGALTTRYLWLDKILFLQVVAQGVSGVREALKKGGRKE